MAVVDYGSIVKGALKSFNEVDQYIQAEEEREYQKAKERRDHLYKSDRDKMADFRKDYEQQYKEYRDNVSDDFNERKFEETKNQNAHQREMDYENLAFKRRQQDEIEKVNETNARNQAFKNALALEKAKTENVYSRIGGSTRSKSGSYLNGVSPNAFTVLPKEVQLHVNAIINNSDTPEQKLAALEVLKDELPEELKAAAESYYYRKSGFNTPKSIESMNNLSNVFKITYANAVKDGQTLTQEELARNFVENANENNQEDIEQVFRPVIETYMSGLAKYKENGQDVLIREFGGYIPDTARFYPIEGTTTVGLIGDFMVNGKIKHLPITYFNGQPYALDENIIKSIDAHSVKMQIENVKKNRPKLLSEKEYNQIYKDDENKDYTNYLLENAMPIQTYNKDPNIVTLKDEKAKNYEINQAIQKSQEKPGTSATSNIYENRYNGKRVGNKVLIDGGKIEVPITEEEDQILKSYKEQADKILSQQFNEDDIAKVQQTYNLSRPHAIKYLQDKASQESFNKRYAPMLKKMTTVDVIEKGFQGDFSDNTFDILTRDLKGDYVFVNEKANKVISEEEYQKLSKEEKDKYEKTNIRDDEDRLNVALMQNVPNEDYRKTFIKQYKQFKDERDGLRADAGGDEGDYVRKFLKTKISEGDKSLPKEKLEEMYRIIERYKDEPLGDVWGIPTTSKAELLSELKDAGLSGTDMYRVIKDLQASGEKGVNSFNEKRYSYTKAYKPKKKSIQKLSDATSKQQNPNNIGGGYQSTSVSANGIVKGKKFDNGFNQTEHALQEYLKHTGLTDLNQ